MLAVNEYHSRQGLTSSADLLLMGRVSESLAGRASYLSLRPMTRREQLGLGRCGIWEELLAASESEWAELVAAVSLPPVATSALSRRSHAVLTPVCRRGRAAMHPNAASSGTMYRRGTGRCTR